MKIKIILLISLGFTVFTQAQQIKPISLKQAVNTAWKSSNKAKISAENTIAAEQQLRVIKNKQYPDFKISGQYAFLTDPNLKLQFDPTTENNDQTEEEASTMPTAHYLVIGQASLSIPIFAGFKLSHAVNAGESNYKAAQLSAKWDKESIALKVVKEYVTLFKARKTVELIQENLKSAKRRVHDFTDMEKNGLLARNDLLKAKLQQSNVELSLAKAKKSARILNYRLAVYLQLPQDTKIIVDTLSFGLMNSEIPEFKEISRPDIEALRYQVKAAEENIKMEEGSYYPSIAITSGYLAADIENTLSVSRAFNIGLGLSYNLSDIFKNKSDVKLAKSRARDIQFRLDEAKDQVNIAIQNAREEYQLAINNYQVYKKAKNQATENYRIVKDKYDNGLLETRDLLEADVQQLQSEINVTTGKANITEKYYMLKKAEGKLTQEFANN